MTWTWTATSREVGQIGQATVELELFLATTAVTDQSSTGNHQYAASQPETGGLRWAGMSELAATRRPGCWQRRRKVG